MNSIPSPANLAPLSAQGEVAGSFLLGLVESFCHLDLLPEESGLSVSEIDPERWYPHALLINILQRLEQAVPSSRHIFFRAGVHFLRIWYERGPGRTMISSTLDWLYANKDSGGYNSVVRGGSPNEIGWCLLQSMDEEAGVAVYENVMPLHPDYVKGVFYGGCMIFDDVEFVDVEATSEPYAPNPALRRTMLTVRFRLKPKTGCQDLEARLDALRPGDGLPLTAEEVESLVWRYKGLKIRNQLDTDYHSNINAILANTIRERREAELALSAYRDHLEALVKARTAELASAKEAAEAANVAKSAFLANMSHEMRTPLHQIGGLATMVRRDPLTPRQMDRLDRLDFAVRHMTGLVETILELTRLEAGKLELEEKPVAIDTLLRDVVASLHLKAEAKGLRIATEAADLPAGLLGDPKPLQTALLHIASNAVRFTEAGGVTIRVTRTEEDASGATLRFEVEDTGIGIAPEVLPRLFSIFEQADNSATRKYGGTGVGLFVTRKIARLMGGDAGCRSTPGEGSTFWFTARLKKRATSAS